MFETQEMFEAQETLRRLDMLDKDDRDVSPPDDAEPIAKKQKWWTSKQVLGSKHCEMSAIEALGSKQDECYWSLGLKTLHNEW